MKIIKRIGSLVSMFLTLMYCKCRADVIGGYFITDPNGTRRFIDAGRGSQNTWDEKDNKWRKYNIKYYIKDTRVVISHRINYLHYIYYNKNNQKEKREESI